MIRFLLDEHVPHAISHGLRLRGVAALTLVDVDLLGADDAEIIAYAQEEQLVIFTQDDDFLSYAASDLNHAGIVYSKQQRQSVGQLIQLLKLVSDCLDPKDMAGRVEYF